MLGTKFYSREPSKPLFAMQNLLTVQNLYRNYRCIMELVKIVKSMEPCPFYNSINISRQNSNRFLTPNPSINFLYKSPWLWNNFRKSQNLENFGLNSEENLIKSLLKNCLLYTQKEDLENWCTSNFTEFLAVKSDN